MGVSRINCGIYSDAGLNQYRENFVAIFIICPITFILLCRSELLLKSFYGMLHMFDIF